MDAGRMLGVADRVLAAARFATELERTKNVTLGVARGVGEGTRRSEPPVVRMVLGMVDGGVQADRRHEATKGVQHLRQLQGFVHDLRRSL